MKELGRLGKNGGRLMEDSETTRYFQHSGKIGGTFGEIGGRSSREASGKLRGTSTLGKYLRKIWGNISRKTSRIIQGTFGELSGNIRGTIREHSGNIQGTFREHSAKKGSPCRNRCTAPVDLERPPPPLHPLTNPDWRNK
jgi:hypothetical protein